MLWPAATVTYRHSATSEVTELLRFGPGPETPSSPPVLASKAMNSFRSPPNTSPLGHNRLWSFPLTMHPGWERCCIRLKPTATLPIRHGYCDAVRTDLAGFSRAKDDVYAVILDYTYGPEQSGDDHPDARLCTQTECALKVRCALQAESLRPISPMKVTNRS
jgi:hypothetical protein